MRRGTVPIPCFDMHCDTIFMLERDGGTLRQNDGQFDLERAGGLSLCQFFALYTPAEHPEADCWPHILRMWEILKAQVAANAGAITLCSTAEQAAEAVEAGGHAAFVSIESADPLENDTEKRMDFLAHMGVRLMSLTHNADNGFACGAMTESDKGLSPRGRELIAMAESRGIVLDVSHLSQKSFYDALPLCGRPAAASHSSADAVTRHPRNLTDEQFIMIKQAGGFVGLNLHADFIRTGAAATIDDALRHAEHFLALGGEHTLGFGCDLDGCTLPQGFTGIESMAALYERMLKAGYAQALVRDIFYGNGMGFLRRAFSSR